MVSVRERSLPTSRKSFLLHKRLKVLFEPDTTYHKAALLFWFFFGTSGITESFLPSTRGISFLPVFYYMIWLAKNEVELRKQEKRSYKVLRIIESKPRD